WRHSAGVPAGVSARPVGAPLLVGGVLPCVLTGLLLVGCAVRLVGPAAFRPGGGRWASVLGANRFACGLPVFVEEVGEGGGFVGHQPRGLVRVDLVGRYEPVGGSGAGDVPVVVV